MTTLSVPGQTLGGWIGQAIGGFVGGLVGGPPGALAGRYLGGQAGRIAGAAAAAQIAQMMEDANEEVEEETEEGAQDKTCADCGDIDCFPVPEGEDPEEFARQLKEQQDAINEMSPDEIIGNMDRYAEFGRPAGDAAARRLARNEWIASRGAEIAEQLMSEGVRPGAAQTQGQAQATAEARGQHATHAPDLIAGGDGTISGLGSGSSNSSIGSSWRHGRADQLRQNAQNAKAQGADKMDVELEPCPPEGGSNTNSPTNSGPGQGSQGLSTPGNMPMS